MPKQTILNNNQLLFKELFVGTLIYAVVIGFFNDYTSIVYAKSFSTIFYAAIVLQLLTMGAFKIKGAIVSWLKPKSGALYKTLMVFCVWFVMFISKFVFVWVIDIIFGNNININGFFGILAVVAIVTIVHKVADYTFARLGNN